jgi:hypothetical protein
MIRRQIEDAMKQALLARDEIRLSTLRLMLAALKDRDIAERGKGNAKGLDNNQILAMLQSMIKQRQESIEMYRKGGRQDLVDREASEIAIIEDFLPPPLGENQVIAIVDSLIAELDATTLKDMGRVMARLKDGYAGQIDLSKAARSSRRG